MAPRKNQEVGQKQEEEKSKIVQESVKEKSRKIEIDRDVMVSVRNVTSGKVIYVSKKTGAVYTWDSYGTEEFLEAGEVITMKSTYPRILTEPWLVIDDEDLIKYLSLDKVYNNMLPLDQLDEFFTWPAEKMENVIKKIPNGIKQLIGEKAREIADSLNGYQRKAIEDNLNIFLT